MRPRLVPASAHVAIVLAFVLSACAPLDPETLRTDPGRSSTFQTAVDYRTVYSNVSRAFLKCMTGFSFQMRFVIQPRIDPASRTASITYVHHGAWTDIWAVIDITAKDVGASVRVNTTSHPLISDLPTHVERWAGGNDECAGSTPVTNQLPLQE